jgi:TRAP-type C4-dicarboxylate transport system permease small subunit
MISRFLDWIFQKLVFISGFFLVAMVVLTCLDVVGRFFDHPFFGTYELVSLMAALVVVGTLPESHLKKGHFGVEIVANKFSPRIQNILELVTDSLSLALFCVVAWRMMLYGAKIQASGEVSMSLNLPEYIVIYMVGFGFVFFCLAILKNIVRILGKIQQG